MAGEEGVAELLDNLRADLDMTLVLIGQTRIRDLDRSCSTWAYPAA